MYSHTGGNLDDHTQEFQGTAGILDTDSRLRFSARCKVELVWHMKTPHGGTARDLIDLHLSDFTFKGDPQRFISVFTLVKLGL